MNDLEALIKESTEIVQEQMKNQLLVDDLEMGIYFDKVHTQNIDIYPLLVFTRQRPLARAF